MTRAVMTTDAVHGSDSNLVTELATIGHAVDNTDGMSLVVNGEQLTFIYNPTGGSTRTLTVPSSECSHHRTNDALIDTISITSPGYAILPKFRAQGWTQGAEGIHLDASGSGLQYFILTDPTD